MTLSLLIKECPFSTLFANSIFNLLTEWISLGSGCFNTVFVQVQSITWITFLTSSCVSTKKFTCWGNNLALSFIIKEESCGTFYADTILELATSRISVLRWSWDTFIVCIQHIAGVTVSTDFSYSIKVLACWRNQCASIKLIEIETQRTFYAYLIFKLCTSRINRILLSFLTLKVLINTVTGVTLKASLSIYFKSSTFSWNLLAEPIITKVITK